MMRLFIIAVVLFALFEKNEASSTTTTATKPKQKREYYSYSTDHPYYDDSSSYENSRYDAYGRKLKNKIKSNAAVITKQTNNRNPDGSYSYEYETDNGIQAHETSMQNGNDKVVRGSYSYIGPDGIVYTVNYIADKYGYRAYGSHLPTQPDAVVNQVQRIASSSTIDPYLVQTNSDIRPGVIQVSPDYTYSSTTIAPPIVRTTLISPPEQVITYSTTPSPYRKSGLYDTPLPEITYSSTPSSFLEPNIIIPSNTMRPPLQYIPAVQSSSVTRFPYISSTNVNLEENIYSSTPRPSYNQPLPSQTADSDYNDNDTVYITPPPKTYIHPVTTYEYLQRELLPPYATPNQQQNAWNVPNVRPLISYDRYYNSPGLPQRFYKK